MLQHWQAFNAEFYGAYAAGRFMDRRQAGTLFAREARRMGLDRETAEYRVFFARCFDAYREITRQIVGAA